MDHPFEKATDHSHGVTRWVIVAGVAILVLAPLLRREAIVTRFWPTTDGVVTGSRVIKDQFHGPGDRILTTYSGEYHVEYLVDGKKYAIWVPAGLVDADQRWVAERMEGRNLGSHYRVRYNPRRPEQAWVVNQ